MRLGVIHMPHVTNDGQSLAKVHDGLQKALVNSFGGLTHFPASGKWLHNGAYYVESVEVYQIAAEPTAFNSEKLRQIAIHYGIAAEQLAVYVQDFFGEVQILNCDCSIPTEGIHP